jgi:hypothetical protein
MFVISLSVKVDSKRLRLRVNCIDNFRKIFVHDDGENWSKNFFF